MLTIIPLRPTRWIHSGVQNHLLSFFVQLLLSLIIIPAIIMIMTRSCNNLNLTFEVTWTMKDILHQDGSRCRFIGRCLIGTGTTLARRSPFLLLLRDARWLFVQLPWVLLIKNIRETIIDHCLNRDAPESIYPHVKETNWEPAEDRGSYKNCPWIYVGGL